MSTMALEDFVVGIPGAFTVSANDIDYMLRSVAVWTQSCKVPADTGCRPGWDNALGEHLCIQSLDIASTSNHSDRE